MPVIDVARRGARAARGVLRRSRPADPAVASSAVELKDARRQIRRLRSKLTEQRAQSEALSAELKLTRQSVRDPDPTVVLPDGVLRVIDQVREERLTYLRRRTWSRWPGWWSAWNLHRCPE